MRDFCTIIEVLKEYLADGRIDKVLDKSVAEALEMPQNNFATAKRRNSIPYEQILLFCKREEISCCEIFFEE